MSSAGGNDSNDEVSILSSYFNGISVYGMYARG
jgi:hypothetical protein